MRCLLVLAFLCIVFSDCMTYKPYANSVSEPDSLVNYEKVIRPYYKRKVSVFGGIMNVTFTGAGAAAGYYANMADDNDKANGKAYKDPLGLGGQTPSATTQLYYVAGGAVAGYLISRLFYLHSHKRRYYSPISEYPQWVSDYDHKKKRDFIFINDKGAYNDTSMLLFSKGRESTFKPQTLYDLKVFTSLFPKSVYTDTAIMYVNPLLSLYELDTVISLYPENKGVFTSKVEYVCRSKSESDFVKSLEKYNDAQADEHTQIKYSQLVETYPFATDFIARYPSSIYFDDIYQRLYTRLSWYELSTVINLYPAAPADKAIHAKTQYFEMATTFHTLHTAVTTYPDVPYAVKPEDNLNTRDSAKGVFDHLKGYQPISPVNNVNRVIANVPEEYLVIQNKQANSDQVNDLYKLASEPWVNTDSATDIIDAIFSRYARGTGEDLSFLVPKGQSYDSGRLYKHDGTVLKGSLIKDKTDIVDFGVKISSSGKKEVGNFADGLLNGNGKVIMSSYTMEGTFKGGILEGIGKIWHPEYVDSGIFHNNKLNNLGVRLYTNGNKYDGNFLEAKFNGHGTFTWSGNQKSYTGDFKSGAREGRGKLDFHNGYAVRGTWKNDCPDGDVSVEKSIKQGKTMSTESGIWKFSDCKLTDKTDTLSNLPFTETEILEKLPSE